MLTTLLLEFLATLLVVVFGVSYCMIWLLAQLFDWRKPEPKP